MTVEAAPRSWFLSLTAIWHEATGFEALRSALEASLAAHPLAGHQTLLPISTWHSTAFAILQITGKEETTQTASDHAATLLRKLTEATDLVQQIRRVFRPLTVTTEARKCFDNSTTVQFAESPAIETFREAVRPFLAKSVATLISGATPTSKLESLLDDRYKSRGNRFFGSMARSPFPLDSSFFRWQVPLPPISLTFDSIHLLVSDDALTNPRVLDYTDFSIVPQVTQ